MKPDLHKLIRKLGYEFANPRLLEQALTHRSVGSTNYERLEFLGDSVLNFVIAQALFDRFPNATEGELSRLRATLVKGVALASIARELELGDYLNLGSGELKSGGFRRDSILADALEAIFGAVLLDSDFSECRKLILRHYKGRVENVKPGENLKDPKSRLQEWLQSNRKNLPVYEVIQLEGDPHNQIFTVECRIAELHITTTGVGSSRRRAEQAAAKDALLLILEEEK